MEGSLTDSNTSHSTDIQTRAAQADFDATRGASAQYTDFSRLVSPVSSQSSFSQDTEPSWLHRHDPVSIRSGEGEFGCSHYRRRCKLVAPCCDKAYWCRHCHNDSEMEMQQDPAKQHQLDRTQVKEVICALCDKRQPISETCTSCGTGFGAYSCLKCSFFEDNTEKEQFHCADCGICRTGGQDNFFHCAKCACCYHIGIKGKHVCVENSMHSNCPVCFEFLFDSCVATSVLKCGHTIHSSCLKQLSSAGQTTCPICMRSYGDMTAVWKRLDAEIQRVQMPAEYSHWLVTVLCNDCHVTSTSRYHILGQKCECCGSYNTRRDTVTSTPSEAQSTLFGRQAPPEAPPLQEQPQPQPHSAVVPCMARSSPPEAAVAAAQCTAGAEHGGTGEVSATSRLSTAAAAAECGELQSRSQAPGPSTGGANAS